MRKERGKNRGKKIVLENQKYAKSMRSYVLATILGYRGNSSLCRRERRFLSANNEWDTLSHQPPRWTFVVNRESRNLGIREETSRSGRREGEGLGLKDRRRGDVDSVTSTA